MVIVNSDSNQTLVSLGQEQWGFKHQQNSFRRVGSLELLQQAYAKPQDSKLPQERFVETCLYLPRRDEEALVLHCREEHEEVFLCSQEEDDEREDSWGEATETSCSSFFSEDEDDSSFHSCSSGSAKVLLSALPWQDKQEPLYLPSLDSEVPVDDCLGYLPSLTERKEALMAQPCQIYDDTNKSSATKLLYVGQGEVGHAVPLQTDVILSDRATTCHILMLYSTSTSNVPLASCAHLDGPHYQDCLADLFARHAQHHGDSTVEMDIHVCGGLKDEHSKSLTSWLLRQLANLAKLHQNEIRCTLQTACVSSLNTTLEDTPMMRGLALNLRTGEVFCARVPDLCQTGPHFALRQARLWCGSSNNPKLTQVHCETSNVYEIAPFCIPTFSRQELELLLQLDDNRLLQSTSTSPHAEDATFCHGVRATLQVLMEMRNGTAPVFGDNHQPLRYKRRPSKPNTWVRM